MLIDKHLISKLKKGDAFTQKAFYKKYFGYIMGIGVRYLPREEALEATQDIFLKIFKNIGKYDTERDLKKWISSISINECIDRFRKNKKRKNEASLEDELDSNIAFINVEINETLDAEYILKLIDKINKYHKTVFLLYVVDGYSHKEISELLNININTSRWHLAEARKEIRPLIEKYYLADESGTGKYY